ncbi:MAG: dihydroorotate dehydrogenase electron transfer subunit [Clostridia bacterium]|nr:dihydroorotate dehydrogenase electron transfer subunit [Clostridia bacterium]
MKDAPFTILSNAPLTNAVYELTLAGDTAGIVPGQFVNVRLPGFYLRRPISVCDRSPGRLTLVYKVVGAGTDALAKRVPGETLDLLTPLGNGYDLTKAGQRPLLVGGGVGVPPLYLLAKELISAGKAVRVVLGFNTKAEVFYEDRFLALGCEVTVATADGSYGVKGFVTDALPENYTYFYACGPVPMLKALCEKMKTEGELSLEERMGCGFGACMGCTHQTKSGPKRVCKEGPVFRKEELLWT